MQTVEVLIERVRQVQNGFTDIRQAADEIASEGTGVEYSAQCLALAEELYRSEVHQARMLATFIWGHLAAENVECLTVLHDTVSRDADWRVQEILAQAFDMYCKAIGYEKALPLIKQWLTDEQANVRRAASEGLRIWTARPYFREHPEVAIHLLSQNKGDESEYVRKSVGNALRDISKKHADLIRIELQGWDTSDKKVAQTYKLAGKFLE